MKLQHNVSVDHIRGLLPSLRRHATGANIHTANKAHIYLKQVLDILVKQGVVGPKSYRHVQNVQAALTEGKWKELEDSMRGWF